MNKFILSFFVAVLLCVGVGDVLPLSSAHAASVGLIKGPGETVYWYSSNGKRYVFPTFGTFWSWYGDGGQSIQLLSVEELGQISIGGNMTYRPGVRLIKITTDPKVYAVSRYGTLRWVTSEGVATQLYGPGWSRLVHDIPDQFFVNYQIGLPIYSTSDYDPAAEKAAVTSPEQNLGLGSAMPVAPLQHPAIVTTSLLPEKYQFADTESIRFSASASDADGLKSFKMYINNRQVNECTVAGMTSMRDCTFTFLASSYADANGRLVFTASSEDRFGSVSWSDARVVSVIPSNTGDSRFRLSTSQATVRSGDSVTLTSTLNPNVRFPVMVRTDIIDPRTAQPIASCRDLNLPCSVTLPLEIRLGVTNIIFHAKGYDASGNLLADEWFPLVSIIEPSFPTPVITSPIRDQVLTNFPRTLTISWSNTGARRHVVNISCATCWPVVGINNSDVNLTTESYQTSVNVTITGDDDMRVRVQAIGENGQTSSLWSDTVNFRFRTTPSVSVSTPRITSPMQNQTFTNYPRTMSVSWQNDGYPQHLVELTCDVCESTSHPWSGPVTYTASNGAMSYQLPPLAGDNQFRVRVQAMSTSGLVSPWSDYVYFGFQTAR